MIQIDVEDAAVQRMFSRLIEASQDLSPAMRAIGQEMETRTASGIISAAGRSATSCG
ncbi:hypothetical protein MASR1M8_10520 [Thermomonas brevis]